MVGKGLLSTMAIGALGALAFAFIVFSSSLPAYALSTTTAITGWLFPDAAHWNNGFGALLFPIVGVGLFAGMGRIVGLTGDFSVTLILAGLTVGGLLAMLSLNASTNNVLPFALVLVPGVDLVIWMWKGNG